MENFEVYYKTTSKDEKVIEIVEQANKVMSLFFSKQETLDRYLKDDIIDRSEEILNLTLDVYEESKVLFEEMNTYLFGQTGFDLTCYFNDPATGFPTSNVEAKMVEKFGNIPMSRIIACEYEFAYDRLQKGLYGFNFKLSQYYHNICLIDHFMIFCNDVFELTECKFNKVLDEHDIAYLRSSDIYFEQLYGNIKTLYEEDGHELEDYKAFYRNAKNAENLLKSGIKLKEYVDLMDDDFYFDLVTKTSFKKLVKQEDYEGLNEIINKFFRYKLASSATHDMYTPMILSRMAAESFIKAIHRYIYGRDFNGPISKCLTKIKKCKRPENPLKPALSNEVRLVIKRGNLNTHESATNYMFAHIHNIEILKECHKILWECLF